MPQKIFTEYLQMCIVLFILYTLISEMSIMKRRKIIYKMVNTLYNKVGYGVQGTGALFAGTAIILMF